MGELTAARLCTLPRSPAPLLRPRPLPRQHSAVSPRSLHLLPSPPPLPAPACPSRAPRESFFLASFNQRIALAVTTLIPPSWPAFLSSPAFRDRRVVLRCQWFRPSPKS
eukprot:3941163-Rhodomonas_salina.1